MAESLRRLVNIGSFATLQDKLDRWLDIYHVSYMLSCTLLLFDRSVVYIEILRLRNDAVTMQAPANILVAMENMLSSCCLAAYYT